MSMIHIGTSGWTYEEWKNIFYPSDLPNAERLNYYSRHFKTVEINSSFYHEIRDTTYINWYEKTPDNFIFSVKINRFITHIKKLNDPRESWERFIGNANSLKEKLGPILFQLPPNLEADKERIENLLKIVPKKYKIAIEPRHPSWFSDEVYEILKKYNAVMVIAESGGRWPSVNTENQNAINLSEQAGRVSGIADFIYIRMHGPSGSYDSKYSAAELKNWAEKIKSREKEGMDIYVYFNNDAHGYAVENAEALKSLLI